MVCLGERHEIILDDTRSAFQLSKITFHAHMPLSALE